MTITPLALPTGSARARHGHAGNARLINCYAENVGNLAKEPVNLHLVDGFDDFSTLTGGGSLRAMLALTEADLYVVSGRLLFRVDQSGTATVLGGIPTDGAVTMARNRKAIAEIAILSDGLYYKVQGGVLTQMADPDLPPAVSVDNLNGYFIFMLPDGRLFSSELDETNVLSTDFAQASSKPDGGVRGWVRGQDFLAGGTASIEVWVDQGNETFPLGRVTNIKRAEDDRDIGVLAARSVCESWFVGSDKTVREIRGYQAVMISEPYLNRLIEAESDPTAITGCLWSSAGHTFYAVSGTSWTYVWDAVSKRWHERQSYGSTRWKVASTSDFGTRVIFGDAEDGKLYRLNTSPTIVTSQTAQTLMIDYADDGINFGNQRMVSLGAEGQRLRKARVNRLGKAAARTYRLSLSAAIEAGSEVVMEAQLPAVHAFPHQFIHHALYVDAVPGLGAADGRASMLSVALDAEKARP